MTGSGLPNIERRGIAAFVRQYPYVHQGIGLLGNALFITGSVLFIVQRQDVGVLAFLSGSICMFIGQFGEVMRGLGKRRLRRHDLDPRSGK